MHNIRLNEKSLEEMIDLLKEQFQKANNTTDKISFTYKFSHPAEEKVCLKIEEAAWRKINALVATCDKEVAWHCTATKTDSSYIIEDVFVFPQIISAATVTTDDTEYAKWLMALPDNIFNKLRVHGHSHVNMDVTPSGRDTTYQENILTNVKDFFIFMIQNKKGDIWKAIYDVEANIVYENDDILVITPDVTANVWAAAQIETYAKPAIIPTVVHQPTVTAASTKPKATVKEKGKRGRPPKTDYDYGQMYMQQYYGHGYNEDWD